MPLRAPLHVQHALQTLHVLVVDIATLEAKWSWQALCLPSGLAAAAIAIAADHGVALSWTCVAAVGVLPASFVLLFLLFFVFFFD